MGSLLSSLALTQVELSVCVVAVFAAGLVRGFAGFALSALMMGSLVTFIPPVQLIPVCWAMEMGASLLMIGGGMRDAEKGVVAGLGLGALCGIPGGLYFTHALPVATSKAIALALIMFLAISQLVRLRARFLATKPGVFVSGLLAGAATGLASLGGMVVALYVLARDRPARTMRGSLVVFIFLSVTMTMVFLWLDDMFTSTSLARSAVLFLPCMAGVIVGKAAFRPRLEPYYKPFCLFLLVALALSGLIKLAVA